MSIVRSVQDAPTTIETTWEELVQSLRVPVVTPVKESCFLYLPAVYPPGVPRQKEYVESVSFGVMDYDHLTFPEAKELFSHLGTLPFPWVLHTTHSNTAPADGITKSGSTGKVNPRGTIEYAYRFLFPFLSPVPGKEWANVWLKLASMLSTPGERVRPDPQCKDSSRPYYVFSAHPERVNAAQFVEHNQGARVFDPSVFRVGSMIESTFPGYHTGEVINAPKQRGGGAMGGVSRPMLESLASRLKRKGLATGKVLLSVLDGVPWAQRGERDTLLYQLAGDIAQEFPTADMRQIAEFFTLSLHAMNDPDYTSDLVLDKLLRRQQEVTASEQEKGALAAIERANRIRAAYREVSQEREVPYSETEVAQFAVVANVKPAEFERRWILQSGGSFYFFFNGGYVGPFQESDAQLAAGKYLSPAPVELDSKDSFGRTVPRTIQQLATKYGTHARHIVADLNADMGWFDAAHSTLIEAPCPLRRLNPRFDPVIDEWLKLMCGDKYSVVCDWMSWVTDLDRVCAALYLQGAPGTGKGLFAKGIARLWRDGPPTAIDDAFDKFNDAILDCPLVFADEKVPKDFKGNAQTAELRELIQQESGPLRRKFKGPAVRKGAVRMIIAANNKNLLQTSEALTVFDIQAIADRIIHVPVNENAAHFLSARRSLVNEWVTCDRIAEHALWHVENRAKTKDPPRFLVRADKTALHLDIGFNTTMGSAVAHWLVSWLDEPARLWAGKPAKCSAHRITYVHGTGVIVSAQCISDEWERYKTNIKADRATLRAVGLALGGISSRKMMYTFSNGRTSVAHVIPLESLHIWGEENGIHPEEITENANKLLEMLKAGKVGGIK